MPSAGPTAADRGVCSSDEACQRAPERWRGRTDALCRSPDTATGAASASSTRCMWRARAISSVTLRSFRGSHRLPARGGWRGAVESVQQPARFRRIVNPAPLARWMRRRTTSTLASIQAAAGHAPRRSQGVPCSRNSGAPTSGLAPAWATPPMVSPALGTFAVRSRRPLDLKCCLMGFRCRRARRHSIGGAPTDAPFVTLARNP